MVRNSSQFEEAQKTLPELKALLPRAQDDINPLRALELFEKISSEVCGPRGWSGGGKERRGDHGDGAKRVVVVLTAGVRRG